MLIQFRRREVGECISVIYRPDGVVLELPSYSRKFRVPHDLAHAVTERELRMPGGVYGLIASGHVFANMTVVAGRPRHDATARSERVMKVYGGSINTAEILAGVLHHAVESGQWGQVYQQAVRAWGVVQQDPFPWSAEVVRNAVETLREHDGRWQALRVGAAMDFVWPDSLIQPVPPAARQSGRYKASPHTPRR